MGSSLGEWYMDRNRAVVNIYLDFQEIVEIGPRKISERCNHEPVVTRIYRRDPFSHLVKLFEVIRCTIVDDQYPFNLFAITISIVAWYGVIGRGWRESDVSRFRYSDNIT